MTVTNAIGVLRDEGLVTTRQGSRGATVIATRTRKTRRHPGAERRVSAHLLPAPGDPGQHPAVELAPGRVGRAHQGPITAPARSNTARSHPLCCVEDGSGAVPGPRSSLLAAIGKVRRKGVTLAGQAKGSYAISSEPSLSRHAPPQCVIWRWRIPSDGGWRYPLVLCYSVVILSLVCDGEWSADCWSRSRMRSIAPSA